MGHILKWTLAGTLVALMPRGVWGQPSGILLGAVFGAALALILYAALISVSGLASGAWRIPRRWPSLRAPIVAQAIFEELVWRGLAFQVLREYVPTAAAFAVSVSGFALLHFESQGAKGVLVHLITGVSFAGAVLVTGSLAAAVVAHLAYNLLAVPRVSDLTPTPRT